MKALPEFLFADGVYTQDLILIIRDSAANINKLLEEFEGAEYGFMFDKFSKQHNVVVFESPEDHLSFKLKYGHLVK